MKRVFLLSVSILAIWLLTSCGGGGTKEVAAATAVFMVEDIFNLSEKGVVVAGEMLDGVIRVGDRITHYNKEGKKVFSGTVKAIEQPPAGALQEASADARRKHYAIAFKENKQKSDFVIEGFLANGDVLKWKELRNNVQR